jgi:lipoyl(octanoyl) transferase
MEYQAAYRLQCQHLEEVLEARGTEGAEIGRILLVEHDPVVTIGRRPGAAMHLVASPELLARRGIAVVETDRGGDITYHGPGQLVCYPIIDLNALAIGLHAWMRLLEDAVIGVCKGFGIQAGREEDATGVWVPQPNGSGVAKICAMGVRVRRWITMHGLALNVTTDLSHFSVIIPCGLAGRPVTSLERELSTRGRCCPPMDEVKRSLAEELRRRLRTAD